MLLANLAPRQDAPLKICTEEEIVRGLSDNTISDDDIDFIQNKFDKYEDYWIHNFFMMHITPLFTKDLSKTLIILNSINPRMPTFITEYINFCMNHNIDNYYGEESNKYEINNQLIKLLHLFIENKFITLENIIDLLDYEKNNKLNLFFASDVITSFPQIKEIAPQIVEKVQKYHLLAEKLFKDPEICRDVAWPSVIKGDTSNPRISKFGGVQPFLPEEGYTLCRGCHSNCSMICQIYIPTTPKWFQDRFPPEYRDSLIVVLYCNYCYLHVEPKFYIGSQLDLLVYANDIVYSGNYTFNEPRIVTGWTNGKMMPLNCNYNIIKKLSSLYFGNSENFKEYFSRFNYIHGPKGNNGTYIGGWPDFVQDDCTPKHSIFVINLSQSCSSTAMWGDAGTAQVWIKKPEGGYFGELIGEWACC